MSIVNVVFSSDDNYVNVLIVAIQSLLDTSSDKNFYNIYVLSDGISLPYQSLLMGMSNDSRNCKVAIIDISEYKERLENVFVDRHLSIATYYRFFLAEIFPKLDKILYLDTDIIVRSDVAELFNVDIFDNVIAGCKDIAVNSCSFGDFLKSKKLLQELGYINNGSYVNAGVLIFNLNEMRKINASKILLEIALSHKFPFHDQDVINLLFNKRIKFIDEEWNFTTHLSPEMYSSNIRENIWKRIKSGQIKIIHYPGSSKPWINSSILSSYWWNTALHSPASHYFINLKQEKKVIIERDCNKKSKLSRLWKFIKTKFK